MHQWLIRETTSFPLSNDRSFCIISHPTWGNATGEMTARYPEKVEILSQSDISSELSTATKRINLLLISTVLGQSHVMHRDCAVAWKICSQGVSTLSIRTPITPQLNQTQRPDYIIYSIAKPIHLTNAPTSIPPPPLTKSQAPKALLFHAHDFPPIPSHPLLPGPHSRKRRKRFIKIQRRSRTRPGEVIRANFSVGALGCCRWMMGMGMGLWHSDGDGRLLGGGFGGFGRFGGFGTHFGGGNCLLYIWCEC